MDKIRLSVEHLVVPACSLVVLAVCQVILGRAQVEAEAAEAVQQACCVVLPFWWLPVVVALAAVVLTLTRDLLARIQPACRAEVGPQAESAAIWVILTAAAAAAAAVGVLPELADQTIPITLQLALVLALVRPALGQVSAVQFTVRAAEVAEMRAPTTAMFSLHQALTALSLSPT